MKTILKPNYPEVIKKCNCIMGKEKIKKSYLQYLTDESKLKPDLPDVIFFPESTSEVAWVLKQISDKGEKITISGQRTGITGGACPKASKNLISLARLISKPFVYYNDSIHSFVIKVNAGTRLMDIQEGLLKNDIVTKEKSLPLLYYPVDPTERSASIGGTISTNASGARTFFYGPTRNFVYSLTIVLSDGRILYVKRDHKLNNTLSMLDKNGKLKTLQYKPIRIPNTKHVAGYYLKKNIDATDLFIGSEGTLGIVTQAELKLCEKFQNYIYLFLFTDKNSKWLDFIFQLKKLKKPFSILAIEYMDENSIKVLRNYRKLYGRASNVPPFDNSIKGALYLEFAFKSRFSKLTKEKLLVKNIKLLYKFLAPLLKKYKIEIKNSWAGFLEKDLMLMKKFRHALPERINSIIGEKKKSFPELTKVGTDMAVPDTSLHELLNIYHKLLKKSGLFYVIFGHLGNGHLHVNIIPENKYQLQKAYEIYFEFAKIVVKAGGSVSAEHGIGKLKKKFLEIQFSSRELEEMKKVKTFFDENWLLNPGVLFD